MARQTAIGIYGEGKALLDGVLAAPPEGGAGLPAILLCHPHPLLGGDMHNAVLTAIAEEAGERDIASLRFDFRGVGRSEGDFTNGEREWRDVQSALSFLRGFPGVDGRRVGIVAYSFGASVTLRALGKLKPAKAFALIAPPLAAVSDAGAQGDRRPKLFVVGGDDAVCPSTRLQGLLDDLRGPVRFAEVPGGDHTLGGHEEAVARQVCDFMAEVLAG